MERKRYTLLLNDKLKNHMLSLAQKEKNRLREKFEFLENGIWDSGVQVKKLRGVSDKVIFEARLSKGDRIIFTLGKYDYLTAIYIWGIVTHDNIKKAMISILPKNAPFLHFEPKAQESFPDILLDDLAVEYYTQEAIEQKTSEEYGPQKWLVLDDSEWKRLLLASDPDNFEIFLYLSLEQKNILENDPPILLSGTAGSGKTTISVYYLFRKKFLNKKRLFITYSPHLKQFSEKIYKGLIAKTEFEKSEPQATFYTFHKLLEDILQSSGVHWDNNQEVNLSGFRKIFKNHQFYKKYDAELVWEEIRSIIKGAKPPISLQRYDVLLKKYIKNACSRKELTQLKEYLIGLKRFEFFQKIDRLIDKKSHYSGYDYFVQAIDCDPSSKDMDESLFILNEIRKIIEKKTRSFSSPILTYEEYMLLGKKRAPNFLYNRKDIYAIAEFYQTKLEQTGLYDEIDLCRKAVQTLDKGGDTFTYDLVVCDEVQDFADIQLSLIFRLAKSCNQVVFTGDPKQIINPSGFRWEEVKNKFYERGVSVPDVFKLRLNFRCVGNIIKLSNALLTLKQQLIGLTDAEQKEEWKFNGRPPFLITGMHEKQILENIKLTSAGHIILVRSKKEQEHLKKKLHTELVFTIYEAKGLEFDTVFLWKFTSDKKSGDIWRKIKQNKDFLDHSHVPHIRHEINLLYVAITRARNMFIIYDGLTSSDVWSMDIFQDLLYKTEEESVLTKIWHQVSTPKEWAKQADYFFERQYYSAAVECYKNAGNFAKTELAEAYTLVEKKHYKRAAELFEKYSHYEEAANHYEHSGDYQSALGLWKKVGNKKRFLSCRIKLYEKNKNFNKAAEEYMKLGDITNALRNWTSAGNYIKIGDYYSSVKQYKKAAEAFERKHQYASAAACWKKEKQFDKAANLFYKAGDYESAMSLYKKLKDTNRLLSCYLKLEDDYNLALLYEKQKNREKAIHHFKNYADASEENRNLLYEKTHLLDKKHTQLKAAVRYASLGMYEKSAPIFFGKKYYSMAIEEYTKLGNYEKSAECFMKLKDYYQAALAYEKSNLENKWELVTSTFRKYAIPNYWYDRKKGDILFKEAELLKKSGSYEQALARYKAINHDEEIMETYFKLDNHEEALEYFFEHDSINNMKKYLKIKADVDFSSDFLKHILDQGKYYLWDNKHKKKIKFLTDLSLGYLKNHRNDEVIGILDNFCESLPIFSDHSINMLPDSFFHLILEITNYTIILKLVTFYKNEKYKLPERIENFLTHIEQKAKEEKNASLRACHAYMYDQEKYTKLLNNLPLTKKNIMLFQISRQFYKKAVDFYLKSNNFEAASLVCRLNDDFLSAGSILEQAGQTTSAARLYRDNKLYDEALRCFNKLKDEAGMARVYERMNAFDEAIRLWEKLGIEKEVNRVRKKRNKKRSADRQLRLF